MKKLKLLILLVMMSLKVFSQSDTTYIIPLEEPIARLIIKDLIEGDGAKQELSITLEKVLLLNQKIVLKDSVINTQTQQITNYESVILTKDLQFKSSQELSDQLQKDLKKEKRKSRITIIASIAIVILNLLIGG
jgi:hypothetical protein